MWGKMIEEVLKTAEDIKTMRIRGAARIARSAADALRLVAERSEAKNVEEFLEELNKAARLLLNTRPTAVSMPNAVNFIVRKARRTAASGSLKEVREAVVSAAREFIENSLKALEIIGELGAKRIKKGDVIMTHCNSSAAISIILKAAEQGKVEEVYATETRPRFQGRLTAQQLAEKGVKVNLIVDSAARYFMNEVDKVIVGADAVAVNGAVVNKIGTSLIALAAHEARVRFYVAAESYKFSPATIYGELIEIEERPPQEVVDEEFLRKYPRIRVRNPAFDVTPPEYIDLIITDRGVFPPQALFIVLKDEFEWVIEDLYPEIKVVEED
ncbi:ribose 1,5-bisphosphate isomerase [Candidatus Bathyarchaeota archaeon ex4484_40]|nr:MAG: ribose 1,5-bisphosphate isomerase [Candidatus Bathyarchaeota archaeon ex4484_40]